MLRRHASGAFPGDDWARHWCREHRGLAAAPPLTATPTSPRPSTHQVVLNNAIPIGAAGFVIKTLDGILKATTSGSVVTVVQLRPGLYELTLQFTIFPVSSFEIPAFNPAFASFDGLDSPPASVVMTPLSSATLFCVVNATWEPILFAKYTPTGIQLDGRFAMSTAVTVPIRTPIKCTVLLSSITGLLS